MKKHSVLLAVLATLVCCTVSKADITSASWNPDGDGSIEYNNWSFSGSTLSMNGAQYGTPGHMVGEIFTDTVSDPTLTLSSSVNNDTGFNWNGYQVNVVMSVPFTFVGPGPNVNTPADWFLAGVVAPSFQNSGDWNGFWEGTLYFSAGTEVGPADILDFYYSINFGSSTHYIITQEMIPSMVPVPEPSTFALLAIGGLGLAVLRRSSRKSA